MLLSFPATYKNSKFVTILLIQVQVLTAHLFAKVSRTEDSEGTFLFFESSCHLLLPVLLFKVAAILLSALSKDTTSELASLSPN